MNRVFSFLKGKLLRFETQYCQKFPFLIYRINHKYYLITFFLLKFNIS